MRSLSDERLITRVRAGDEAAFEAIYDRHHSGLLSFCRHMLGNQQEAEDAVQHTFIAAYRSLLSGDRDIQLKAWLYAIARNRSLSLLRARREHTPLDDVQPATEGLAAEVERRQDLKELLGDLQGLPEEQRAALVLSEIAAHSHDEIGVILGVPKNKVKALVFQARTSIAGSREARDTPCAEVQEQLATLHGGALRRNQIRRHVETCAACQSFKAETQRQRAAMAIVLPVIPAITLKSGVLGATTASAAGGFGAGGGGVAVGGGVSAAMGGGGTAVFGGGVVATGLAAIAGKSLLTKALVTAAVAGTASGGGYIVMGDSPSSGTTGRSASAQSQGSSGFEVASSRRPTGVADRIGLPAVTDPARKRSVLERVSDANDKAARGKKRAPAADPVGGGTVGADNAPAVADDTQGSGSGPGAGGVLGGNDKGSGKGDDAAGGGRDRGDEKPKKVDEKKSKPVKPLVAPPIATPVDPNTPSDDDGRGKDDGEHDNRDSGEGRKLGHVLKVEGAQALGN